MITFKQSGTIDLYCEYGVFELPPELLNAAFMSHKATRGITILIDANDCDTRVIPLVGLPSSGKFYPTVIFCSSPKLGPTYKRLEEKLNRLKFRTFVMNPWTAFELELMYRLSKRALLDITDLDRNCVYHYHQYQSGNTEITPWSQTLENIRRFGPVPRHVFVPRNLDPLDDDAESDKSQPLWWIIHSMGTYVDDFFHRMLGEAIMRAPDVEGQPSLFLLSRKSSGAGYRVHLSIVSPYAEKVLHNYVSASAEQQQIAFFHNISTYSMQKSVAGGIFQSRVSRKFSTERRFTLNANEMVPDSSAENAVYRAMSPVQITVVDIDWVDNQPILPPEKGFPMSLDSETFYFEGTRSVCLAVADALVVKDSAAYLLRTTMSKEHTINEDQFNEIMGKLDTTVKQVYYILILPEILRRQPSLTRPNVAACQKTAKAHGKEISFFHVDITIEPSVRAPSGGWGKARPSH